MSQDIDYISLDSVSMGASFESEVINVVPFKGGYLQCVTTGSPIGVMTLSASNDPGPSQAVNWKTIPFSTMVINGADVHSYNIDGAYFRYMKIIYTRTSGTGTCSIRIQLKA